MSSYLPLLVMFIAAAVVAFGGLAASAVLGPGKKNRIKEANYECGVEATPNAGSEGKFSVKYFLTAMTFIIFDIEVVFLYPWAVAHDSFGLFGIVTIALFILLITVPFIYEWRRGGLEWE